MNLASVADLQTIAIALALWGAIWLMIAMPAWLVRKTLQGFGLSDFPARAIALARRFGYLGGSLELFGQRVTVAIHASANSARLLVDEKLAKLKVAITNSERAIRAACQGVDDLTNSGGPKPILDQLRSLKKETQKAATFGGGFNDNIDLDYAAKRRATINVIILTVALAVLISFNGALLSRFFDGLIPGQLFGLRWSLIAGLAFVFVEAVLGFALADVSKKAEPNEVQEGPWGRYVLIAAIALLAVFEAIVLGLVSHEFELESELADAYPILRYWMAIVGFAFVIATSFAGRLWHIHLDRLMGLSGKASVKKELAAVNAYVEDLPARWEKIGATARQAEHSIDNYLRALGGSGGVLQGTVDRLGAEREGLIDAFRDAKVDAWPEQIDARPGDIRSSALINLALLALSLAGIWAFASAVAFLLGLAAGAIIPAYAVVALGLGAALGAYWGGVLPFGRVQTTSGAAGRVFPLRGGRFEYALFGLTQAALCIAMVWLGATAIQGAVGFVVGLVLCVGAVVLSVAGYFAERAVAGAALAGALLLAFAAMLAQAIFSAVRTAVLFIGAGLALAIDVLLGLLSAPVTFVLQALRRDRPQAPAPAAAAAAAPKAPAASNAA